MGSCTGKQNKKSKAPDQQQSQLPTAQPTTQDEQIKQVQEHYQSTQQKQQPLQSHPPQLPLLQQPSQPSSPKQSGENKNKYLDKSSIDDNLIPLSREARLEFLCSQKLSKILRSHLSQQQMKSNTQQQQSPLLDEVIERCEISRSNSSVEAGITFTRDRIAEMTTRILKDIDSRNRQALEIFEFFTSSLKKPSYRHLLQLYSKTDLQFGGSATATAAAQPAYISQSHQELHSLFLRVFTVSVKTIQSAISILYQPSASSIIPSGGLAFSPAGGAASPIVSLEPLRSPAISTISNTGAATAATTTPFISKDILFEEIKQVAASIDALNLRKADEIALIVSTVHQRPSARIIDDVVNTYLTNLYEDTTHTLVALPVITSVANEYLLKIYTQTTDKLCSQDAQNNSIQHREDHSYNAEAISQKALQKNKKKHSHSQDSEDSSQKSSKKSKNNNGKEQQQPHSHPNHKKDMNHNQALGQQIGLQKEIVANYLPYLYKAVLDEVDFISNEFAFEANEQPHSAQQCQSYSILPVLIAKENPSLKDL